MSIYFQKSYQRALGTYPLKGQNLQKSVLRALEVGYRAFDTAQMYENESDLGQVIEGARVTRDSICLTTKVHPRNYSENDFIPSVEKSLKKLRVSYVDVLLLHWPPEHGDATLVLHLLQEAHSKGMARHIGVSNYNATMLRVARDTLATLPVTNQVEFHPLLNQDMLMEVANELGIPLSAYCPLARGKALKNDVITELATHYQKKSSQIVLRWILQKGVSTNTMSTNPDNIKHNFNVMDFTLSSVDMQRIDQIRNKNYRIVTEFSPWTPDWD